MGALRIIIIASLYNIGTVAFEAQSIERSCVGAIVCIVVLEVYRSKFEE